MKVRKIFGAVLAAGLVAGALMIPATPAAAAGAGTAEFECTASLNPWPSVGSTGTCDGIAVVRGLSTSPGVIFGQGTLHAAFDYEETCTAGEPLQGTASGTATVTGLTVAGVGGVTSNGKVEVDFEWLRVGGTADITVTGWRVFQGSSLLESGSTGHGEAAFAPTNFNPLIHTCPSGAPLAAEAAGELVIG